MKPILPIILALLALCVPAHAFAQYGGTFGQQLPGYQAGNWTPESSGAVLDLDSRVGFTGSGTSGAAWADQSGHSNNAAYSAGTITTTAGGLRGLPYELFALNSTMQVVAATSLNPTAGVTILAVFTLNAVVGVNGTVAVCANSGSWNDGYGIVNRTGGGTLEFFVGNYNTTAQTSGNFTVASGSSYSLVGQYNGSVVSLYSSGTLVGSPGSYSSAINYTAADGVMFTKALGGSGQSTSVYRLIVWPNGSVPVATIAAYSSALYGI